MFKFALFQKHKEVKLPIKLVFNYVSAVPSGKCIHFVVKGFYFSLSCLYGEYEATARGWLSKLNFKSEQLA